MEDLYTQKLLQESHVLYVNNKQIISIYVFLKQI